MTAARFTMISAARAGRDCGRSRNPAHTRYGRPRNGRCSGDGARGRDGVTLRIVTPVSPAASPSGAGKRDAYPALIRPADNRAAEAREAPMRVLVAEDER